MSSIIESLASPTAVVGFGATTLVLLGTTYYFTSIKSDKSGNGSRRSSTDSNGAANGMVEKVKELDRSKYPGGYLTIYYGSQTGTAQMFAKQIASESESRGFCARVVDLQDVIENEDQSAIDAAGAEKGFEKIDDDAAVIRATLSQPNYRDEDEGRRASKCLFFMATYGEGEPTDNAQQFVEMMKSKSGISNIYKIDSKANGGLDTVGSNISLNEEEGKETMRDETFLRDLDYAVFGLGNKQYEHYNNMSRFIDASLEKCGASRVAAIGLGDDDDDLEGDFETWKDNILWPSLTDKYVKGKAVASKDKKEEAALPKCPYVAHFLERDDKVEVDVALVQTSSKHYSQAVDCPVVVSRELRDPSDPGSTLHMEIDISNHMDVMKYQTADNLGILPKNASSVVESVAAALNLDLNQRFNLVPNKDSENSSSSSSKHTLPFPTPCTVRECLERYCDLTGPPRRSDLKQLAPYARNEIDKKALLRMSSKEGKVEYKEKIVAAHIGIADIVTKLCTSIECPLEHFIMVCPRLQPRYYTISSSSTVHPETIHITLAVLETELKNKKDGTVFKGLCSGFLADLKKGGMVRAFVRDSTFRLPKQVERPVIMFGPGTGIAPMRAVLQERSHGLQKLGVAHGPSILYFGCKNRSMDYIYRDELEVFEKEGTLNELHLAFSREQEKKVYVQHLLANRAEETWKMIHDDNASIFVCGAVKMGADVDHTLQDIISKQGDMSREKAKAYLDKMAVAGRFVQELWS